MAAHCPNLERCPMFKAFSGASGVWKVMFCQGRYEKCKRYEMSCSGRPVPNNLLPNGATIG